MDLNCWGIYHMGDNHSKILNVIMILDMIPNSHVPEQDAIRFIMFMILLMCCFVICLFSEQYFCMNI